MSAYIYCPLCRHELSETKEGLKVCPACHFTHYDNPVPVVAVLVPVESGIVLVQRGVEPFKGEWCLPCGYMNRYEHPKAAARRETEEETGLVVRMEKVLSICNPSPEDFPLNQLVIHYLGRMVAGELQAGDDALNVGVFTREDMPPVCFRSHRMVINEWFNGTWGTITGIDL